MRRARTSSRHAAGGLAALLLRLRAEALGDGPAPTRLGRRLGAPTTRRARSAAARCALLADLADDGHGSASPVRHAGGIPPGARPKKRTASMISQKHWTTGSGPPNGNQQRAGDHAEHAHEAGEQADAHRVERHEDEREREAERAGQAEDRGEDGEAVRAEVQRRVDGRAGR